MRCINCNKIIDEKFNFCPYCGEERENFEKSYDNKKEIEQYYSLLEYDLEKILELSLSGNIYAKNIFVYSLTDYAYNRHLENRKTYRKIYRLSNQGVPFAMAAQGIFELNDGDIREEKLNKHDRLNEAFSLIIKASKMGETIAEYEMANFYATGNKYVQENPLLALQMMEQLAEEGYPRAYYSLGKWYIEGSLGLAKNSTLGLEYLEKAAVYKYYYAKETIKNLDKEWFNNYKDHSLTLKEKDVLKNLISNKEDVRYSFVSPMNFSELNTKNKDLNSYINCFSFDMGYGPLIDILYDYCESDEEKAQYFELLNNYANNAYSIQESIFYNDYKLTLPRNLRIIVEIKDFLKDFPNLEYMCRYTYNDEFISKNEKYIDTIMNILRIPANDDVYFMIDTSLGQRKKNGFAITSSGLYGKITFFGNSSISFQQFSDLYGIQEDTNTIIKGKTKNGQKPLYICQTTEIVHRELIIKLLSHLYDILQEYKSNSDYKESGESTQSINDNKEGLLLSKESSDKHRATKNNFSAMLERICSQNTHSSIYYVCGSSLDVKKSKKYNLARQHFSLPSDENTYLIVDSTVFGSCKKGLAICDSGLYFVPSNGKKEKVFMPWKQFIDVQLNRDGSNLYLDSYGIFTTDNKELLILLKKLKDELLLSVD